MAGLCKRKSPWFNVLLFPVSMHLLFLFTYNHLVTHMESQRNQGLEKWIVNQLLPHCFFNSWPKEFSMRHESRVGAWDCCMQTAGYKRKTRESPLKSRPCQKIFLITCMRSSLERESLSGHWSTLHIPQLLYLPHECIIIWQCVSTRLKVLTSLELSLLSIYLLSVLFSTDVCWMNRRTTYCSVVFQSQKDVHFINVTGSQKPSHTHKICVTHCCAVLCLAA